jgi:hypothetical protein
MPIETYIEYNSIIVAKYTYIIYTFSTLGTTSSLSPLSSNELELSLMGY